MEPSELTVIPASETVWRIGFRPEPWAWSGWEWSTSGRFPGRWDDLHGNFRTVYAGSSLKACLLEVLAGLRPDPRIAAELGNILEDDEDQVLYPTIRPGEVPREWLDARAAARAELRGNYCAVSASSTVSVLYPNFIAKALSLGLTDFDAAALKDARPRQLTQAVAAWLYEMTSVDGVTFSSRHGDDLKLWAIFERPGDPATSLKLGQQRIVDLHHDAAAVLEVFEILTLKWRDE
ncbi:RES family NAD+ phosphorylase [Paenarthrobacter sp. A20]|uniref:RES family NAD+ phosphorylase n=1 Tax=Paenarthrobacter sp. A20 TaxID=2817891 RepID=UPI00209DAC65|nr:RES family NAD+ phosphorylase [Paenarthrobacter sp. A20]MCP1415427.1 RES domain-containing protein [Paenarthrobacter sp. A20]